MSQKALLKNAVHQHSGLSLKGLNERLFTSWFGGLFYNQIWEDPVVDMAALQLTPSNRVLTICSGGCNTLTYLLDRPESIKAIDLNPNHVFLTRLKLAALKYLPTYEDFFSFFGYANLQHNVSNYIQYIRDRLDDATRAYWEGGHWLTRPFVGPRINLFTRNFYNYARLGTFLRLAHLIARIARRNPQALLKASTPEEQAGFFETQLEPFFKHPLVRLVGRIPFLLFGLGIPPRQLKELKEETQGQLINVYRERVRKLACDHRPSENYFMWQAFGRCYDVTGRSGVPEYLKKENYTAIKESVDRVDTDICCLHDYLGGMPDCSLDRFVFLDSQDWMPPEGIASLWTEIARVGRPGTRIIFRTASSRSPVEDALPHDLRSQFIYERDLSLELFQRDRSAIYGGFHIYSLPA